VLAVDDLVARTIAEYRVGGLSANSKNFAGSPPRRGVQEAGEIVPDADIDT
jgi:hypothetical protein